MTNTEQNLEEKMFEQWCLDNNADIGQGWHPYYRNAAWDGFKAACSHKDAEFAKEREQLLGKMTMMQDAFIDCLEEIKIMKKEIGFRCQTLTIIGESEQALSASQPEVEAWMLEHDNEERAKVLEDCATYMELNWIHYVDGTGKVIKTRAAELIRKYAKLRAQSAQKKGE